MKLVNFKNYKTAQAQIKTFLNCKFSERVFLTIQIRGNTDVSSSCFLVCLQNELATLLLSRFIFQFREEWIYRQVSVRVLTL